MDTQVHNPTRTKCQTSVTQHGPFAMVSFECQHGGTATLFFNSPDDLREHAEAMRLLADSLEEKQ